jgi:L-cystine uptake protein TcyP (sodium:dicarboxylate symporter family)
MEIYDVAIVPLIVGVTELFKRLGLPTKFSAVVAAILGVVIGIVYVAPDNIAEGVLVGLSLGLAAAGLYSGVKNTVEGVQGKE